MIPIRKMFDSEDCHTTKQDLPILDGRAKRRERRKQERNRR